MLSSTFVTARNVTFALDSAPDSSQAYESGRKLLSLIYRHDEEVSHNESKESPVCQV